MAYAIVRHQLMDINIVIRKTTQYTLLMAIITAGYIGIVLLSHRLFGGLMGFQSLLPAMVAALLIAFAFVPLKESIRKFVDKTLFKRSYDHSEVIEELSEILSSVWKLDELLDVIIKKITGAMGIKRSIVYLQQPGDGTYVLKAEQAGEGGEGTGPVIRTDDPLIMRLIRLRKGIVREELERLDASTETRAIVARLEEIGVEISIPIFSKASLTGILFLGSKGSGQAFTREDTKMFATLSHQIAIAIENARLYTQVEESKIYQENLLNNLTSGVIAVDLKARIATINKKAGEILKLKAGQAIGKSVEIIPPALRKVLLSALEGEVLNNEEIGVRLKGEKDVPLAVSSSVFRSYEGEPLGGALVVFSDLTQRKILEAEMWRADRLASLGTLAAGLAHEIKNPLVSLQAFTRILPKKRKPKGSEESLSELASREVDRINHLIEQLLDFTRSASPIAQPTDLGEVLKNTMFLSNGRMREHGIEVEAKIEDKSLVIMADREQLKQVFLNLIINALQSMEKGGKLSVRTGTRGPLTPPRGPPGGAGEEHDKLSDRACAVVEISDTGQSIDPEDLPHIFDLFFTTKKTGVGIGLPIVLGIVEQYGGIIKVKDKPADGTTFTIIFPLIEDK